MGRRWLKGTRLAATLDPLRVPYPRPNREIGAHWQAEPGDKPGGKPGDEPGDGPGGEPGAEPATHRRDAEAMNSPTDFTPATMRPSSQSGTMLLMPRTLLLVVLLASALCPLFSQTYGQPFFTAGTGAGTSAIGDARPAREGVFLFPEDMAVDSQSLIYVADTGQHRIRRFDTQGNIVTIAGTGVAGASGDGGPAAQARLNQPRGLAIDGNTLYFSDSGNHQVRAVNLQTGVIRAFAGTGAPGTSGDGGPALEARLSTPWGIAADARGVWICDSGNNRIRRVANGTIAPSAGTGTKSNSGDGSPATLAGLNEPRAIAIGLDQAVYFADYGNRLIRKILPSGILQTVAGKGPPEGSGGNGELGSALESLLDPAGIVVEANGNIVIADPTRHHLRRIISSAGAIEYLAGNGQPGFAGDTGPAEASVLNGPAAVAIDARGNVIFADRNNHRIRRIAGAADRAGGMMDTIAGRGRGLGDGAAATEGVLTFPEGAAVAANGTIYLADTASHCIRAIAPDGRLSTFAGLCGEQGFAGDSGSPAQGRFNGPTSLAVSREGYVYIADTGNNRVRRITPGGVLATVAGPVGVTRPRGLTIDADDQYAYFAHEFEGSRIARHLLARPGDFNTYAGGLGRVGFDGDGGAAAFAVFGGVSDLAMDRNFTLWVMDRGNGRLRKIERNGMVSSVLTAPGGQGVAADAAGAVYFTQVNAGQHRVLRLAPNAATAEVLAGAGAGLAGDGSFSTSARLDGPAGLAVAPNGRVWIADRNNHRARVLNLVTPQRLDIQGGNNQTGMAGSLAVQPLEVRLTLSGGTPLPGATVTFAVASGPASVSPAQATTDADGVASTTVALGPRAGTAVVTAAFGAVEPARFNLTATEPSTPIVTTRPRIAPGGVVGVGNSVPAIRALSANALISIYGENFSVPGTGRRVRAEEFVNGRLPEQFLGVCVSIDGRRAPLVDVFPTQLNVQVPALPSAGSAAVRVSVNCGTAAELTSEVENVPVRAAAPEFLYLVTNADGVNPVAAVNAATGGLIGPAEVIPSAAPARPGDVVTIYGSGFGTVSPAAAPGEFPRAIARAQGVVSLRLGGQTLAASDIFYVGAAPGTVIYQVNFRVPTGVAEGRLPIVLTIGGESSAAGGYLTVGR